VWVIGDSGEPTLYSQEVRDGYLAYTGARETDLWLMLGDNAYGSGTDAQYQAAVFDVYGEILRNSVLWPTRGNHDQLYSGPNNDYYEIFSLPVMGEAGGVPSGTEAWYSFDYGNIHFICLDSEGSSTLPAMMNWVATDLDSTDASWVIAFWHHPPYTKGSHDSDNDSDSGGRMRNMREDYLPLLEGKGVDLVLTGHSHSYERSMLLDEHYGYSSTLHDSMKVDPGDGNPAGDGAYEKPTSRLAPHEGAVHAVAGSSSKISGGTLNHPVMVTSLNMLGSMVLDVHGQQLDAVFIDTMGVVRDEFTIIKGDPTGVPEPPVPGVGFSPNHPNPFHSRTRIPFTLPRDGRVSLALFDASGRRIATLIDDEFHFRGGHHASWDGRDSQGRPVPRGVYFSRLSFEGSTLSRKLILN
jgi:hypothetical protein